MVVYHRCISLGVIVLGPWPMSLVDISRQLARRVQRLGFARPVTHVYNPLLYARQSHELYLTRFGATPKQVLLVGMNPGPFGMAQTGVPFGDVGAVRDWLGIETAIGQPPSPHPKRPVLGFSCPRSEVSGSRLWGWVQARFGSPERFFEHWFVANYCPLVFLESTGRNRTPDKLPAAEREPLFAACDYALRRTVEFLEPQFVIGVGAFARDRARRALASVQVSEGQVSVGVVLHPSPASPRANRGWAEQAEKDLQLAGVSLPSPQDHRE